MPYFPHSLLFICSSRLRWDTELDTIWQEHDPEGGRLSDGSLWSGSFSEWNCDPRGNTKHPALSILWNWRVSTGCLWICPWRHLWYVWPSGTSSTQRNPATTSQKGEYFCLLWLLYFPLFRRIIGLIRQTSIVASTQRSWKSVTVFLSIWPYGYVHFSL